MGYCKICAVSAHRKKNKRVNVYCDLQEELKNDPQFLTKVLTGDESWCYSYDLSQSHEICPDQKSLLKCQDNVAFFFFMLMG